MRTSTKQLRELTGIANLTTYSRYGISKFGEKHYNFVSLFGNYDQDISSPDHSFTGTVPIVDGSLAYLPEADAIIQKINDAGYNCALVFGKGYSGMEIVVETHDWYVQGEGDKRFDELRKKDDRSFVFEDFKYSGYKINKSL